MNAVLVYPRSARAGRCRAIARLAALFGILLLTALLLPRHALAAPSKVNIAPSGSLLLPAGWTISDPTLAAKSVAEAKEKLGMPISSNTVFFAIKNNANAQQIACIALERTQPSPLNNNIIPLLTEMEKEEVYANMRLVMTGVFKQTQSPTEITETTFKTFGRYHTLITSLRQTQGHTPLNSHVVYYFLPKETHILTVVYNSDAAKELNPDFTVILDSFDPDSGYTPAAPPPRKEGEALPDYLGRVYGAAQKQDVTEGAADKDAADKGTVSENSATRGAAENAAGNQGAAKENVSDANAAEKSVPNANAANMNRANMNATSANTPTANPAGQGLVKENAAGKNVGKE